MTAALEKPSVGTIRVKLIQQKLSARASGESVSPRMVATGMTGSGMSALGNLLLGADVLPSNGHSNCTQAVHIVQFPHGLTYIDLPGVGDDDRLENYNRAALGLPQNPDEQVSELHVFDYDWQQPAGERVCPASADSPGEIAPDLILYVIAPHNQLGRYERRYIPDLLNRYGTERLVYVLNMFHGPSGSQIATPQNVGEILDKLAELHQAAGLSFDPARVVTMDCKTGADLDDLLDVAVRTLTQRQGPPIAKLLSYQAEQAPRVYGRETKAAVLQFAAPVADIVPTSDEDGYDQVLAAGQKLTDFASAVTERQLEPSEAAEAALRNLAVEVLGELRHEITLPVTVERAAEVWKEPVFGEDAEPELIYKQRSRRVKVAPGDIGEFFIALGRAVSGGEFVAHREIQEDVLDYEKRTQVPVSFREEPREFVDVVPSESAGERVVGVTYDPLGVRGVALLLATWLVALQSAADGTDNPRNIATAYRYGLTALEKAISIEQGQLSAEMLLRHMEDFFPSDTDRYLESLFGLTVKEQPVTQQPSGGNTDTGTGPVRVDNVQPDDAPGPGSPADMGVHGETSRFLACTVPRNVRPGGNFIITARIIDRAGGATRPMMPLIPTGGAQLDVLISLPPGCELLTPGKQSINMPQRGDSDEAIFWTRAPARPGPYRFTLTVIWNHRELGPMELAQGQVSINVSERLAGTDEKQTISPARAVAPDQPEVWLTLRQSRSLLSCALYGKGGSKVEGEVTITANPRAELKKLTSELSSMAAGAGGWRPGGIRDELQTCGKTLWKQFLPRAIQEALSLLSAGEDTLIIDCPGSVLAIPWEMMYPVESVGGKSDFLVQLFNVVRAPKFPRWTPLCEFSLHPALIVLPDDKVPGALEEARAISEVLGIATDCDSPFIEEKVRLKQELRTKSFGLLHIAAHTADGKGTIGLARGQKFSLRDLTEFTGGDGKWSDQRPLVFINACSTAVPQQSFTQLTSWAETFFEAGAGGFIGSMWNVRSETASAFALRFYEAIYSEQLSFGQALHKARQYCRSHSDDPTWLAYAAYGNHSATMIRH